VFFAYAKQRKEVIGAFIVSECARVLAVVGSLWWRIERFVLFADPPVLDGSDIAWTSTILHLTLAAEHRLRHLESSIGGMIQNHFTEFSASRWWLWPLTHAQLDTLRSGSAPLTMKSDEAVARALKLEPLVVGWTMGG